MSSVYDALQKAERERRWRIRAGTTDTGLGNLTLADSVLDAAAGLVPEAEQRSTPGIFGRRGSMVESTSSASEPNPAFTKYDDRTEQSANNGKEKNGTGQSIEHNALGVARTAGYEQRIPVDTITLASGDRLGPALIVRNGAFGSAAEKFQLLRSNVENWVAQNEKRVIMIVSASPGEGKSFVAVNLAAVLAGNDSRVILIDADLRAPSLHRSFNLVPLNGLLSYLNNDAGFSSCLLSTQIPNLLLVAAGGSSSSAPIAIGSLAMRNFITCARNLVPPHYILIDTPAALPAPEAQILSKFVDAALVVVAANRTPRQAVSRTLEMIKGLPVLGIVVNRFETPYSELRASKYYSTPGSEVPPEPDV